MLNQQIRATIQQFRETMPAELTALIEQGAGEISALDIVEKAKRPGDKMPDFNLQNQHGEIRQLADYLSQGVLVVSFYRGIWCPYCNLQLRAYAERLAEIEAAGARLVAFSPERPGALEILKASGAASELTELAVSDVPFDVLHDADNQVAGALGLVFELPQSHQDLLRAFKIDIEVLNGNNQFTFPDPATYVIKPNGEISWAFVPNNYRKRAEVDAILDAVRVAQS